MCKKIPITLTYFEVDTGNVGKLIRPLVTMQQSEISLTLYKLLNSKHLLVSRLIDGDIVNGVSHVTVLKGISVGTCLHVLTDKISNIEKGWFTLPFTKNGRFLKELKTFKLFVQSLQSLAADNYRLPYLTFEYLPISETDGK